MDKTEIEKSKVAVEVEKSKGTVEIEKSNGTVEVDKSNGAIPKIKKKMPPPRPPPPRFTARVLPPPRPPPPKLIARVKPLEQPPTNPFGSSPIFRRPIRPIVEEGNLIFTNVGLLWRDKDIPVCFVKPTPILPPEEPEDSPFPSLTNSPQGSRPNTPNVEPMLDELEAFWSTIFGRGATQ